MRLNFANIALAFVILHTNLSYLIKPRDSKIIHGDKDRKLWLTTEIPIFMPIDRRLLGRKGSLQRRDIFINRENYLKYGLKVSFTEHFP